jgi:hypothetical protein
VLWRDFLCAQPKWVSTINELHEIGNEQLSKQ